MTDKIAEIEEKYRDFCDNNPDKPMEKEDYFKLHVLNEKNKLVKKKFINDIFKKYNLKHKVKNLDTYQKAFIHDSYLNSSLTTAKYVRQLIDSNMIDDPKKALSLFDASYQRLEYLGDSVIHVAVAQYLYGRYPEQDEGFLTRIRTRIENGEEMGRLARCLGLHEYVIISRSIELADGRIRNYKILEDCFEAFVGALSLELSLDKCCEFVVNIIEAEADISHMIEYETNYKGNLMKECHKNKWDDVEYIDINNEENEEKKIFQVKAICGDDDSKYIGYGKGKSKRKAQQKAAREILIKLGLIINDNIDDDNDFFEVEEDFYEVEDENEEDSNEDMGDDIYGTCESDSN